MVAWLENGEDASSDGKVWGVCKAQYGFGDLDIYLKNGGSGLLSEQESKGTKKSTKEKEKEGSKCKHKEKRKRKGKEKDKSPKKSFK
jgi:hypothetical protein